MRSLTIEWDELTGEVYLHTPEGTRHFALSDKAEGTAYVFGAGGDYRTRDFLSELKRWAKEFARREGKIEPKAPLQIAQENRELIEDFRGRGGKVTKLDAKGKLKQDANEMLVELGLL